MASIFSRPQCVNGVNDVAVSIDRGYGLAPNRQLVISWRICAEYTLNILNIYTNLIVLDHLIFKSKHFFVSTEHNKGLLTD